jgi:hypothetical protein
MRKITMAGLLVFVLGFSTLALALDPVAPRAERKFGEILVESPLPESDLCELTPTSKGGEAQKFKPGETTKVPVGEYDLKVKLQDAEWKTHLTIHPTERADIKVTGYGNLKVTTPNPKSDKVESHPPTEK